MVDASRVMSQRRFRERESRLPFDNAHAGADPAVGDAFDMRSDRAWFQREGSRKPLIG
jgi:hypothetical protein